MEDDIIKNEDTGVIQWVKSDQPIVLSNSNISYSIDENDSGLAVNNSSITYTNPVDKDLDDMEQAMGIKLDKEKALGLSRESLLNFVESQNQYSDLTEEEINQMVDNMLEAVKVPAVIERKEELDEELGLTADDLKTLYKYLSGKSSAKPAFLDRYLAGSQNKLIDFQHVITLIRLAQVPQLAAMNANIQKRLYSPENLLNMDAKDLATASANISREISDTLNNATKSIELINSIGRVDSRYQALMDKLLVVPDDVLNQVEHLLNNYQ